MTKSKSEAYTLETAQTLASDKEGEYLSRAEIEKRIRDSRKAMEQAAKELDFMMAARLRDKIKALQKELEAQPEG